MSRFLITGTGRCGTGWCAETLRLGGVRCGHQSVIRHEHTLGLTRIEWGDWQGESSFEAVPALRSLHGDTRIVLVVRHPAQVVRSWLELGLFRDDMRQRWGLLSTVLDRWFPSVLAQASSVQRAAEFWLQWNLAALTWTHEVHRIEDLDASQLFAAVGVPYTGTPDAPRDTNHLRDRKKAVVDAPESIDRVFCLARQWGYGPEPLSTRKGLHERVSRG